METLTMFIDTLYAQELGAESYQVIENKAMVSMTYIGLALSGSLIKDTVFEDVIFEDCTFFGSTLENCLFINCLFINCKFQFSKFSDCNFENTSWENCKWGLTALNDTEMIASEGKNNYSFITEAPVAGTQTLSLNDFLALPA